MRVYTYEGGQLVSGVQLMHDPMLQRLAFPLGGPLQQHRSWQLLTLVSDNEPVVTNHRVHTAMAVPVRVKWRSGHRTAYALSAMDPVRHSPDEALIVVVNAQRWEFVGGGTALMTWLYRANDPHGPRDGLIALAVGDSVVIDDGALLMCDMGGQLRVFEAEARAAVIAGA